MSILKIMQHRLFCVLFMIVSVKVQLLLLVELYVSDFYFLKDIIIVM